MTKILVIEDDRTIRESILELLLAEGFDAVAAENGKVGVDVAQTSIPDMILCDVTMPEMDGYNVLATLRQRNETATIPFIFLTARSTKEDFRQGMELGADDYLTKPCSADELLGAIASRLQKQTALLSHSQKQLDELRSSIALSLPHELRTPLNGILGLAEVLIEDYQRLDPAEVLEAAQGIHKSAERLYRLIQNFLLYADLEIALRDEQQSKALCAGETRYPKMLIADVATKVARSLGREADLHLNLQNTRVRMADLKLRKVVEELTGNAFKFSKPGTPVRLTAMANSSGLTLYISDRGRGMTPEQIAGLGAYLQFDRRFYEQQGSGLGLAIAKRLIELHGGKLVVESVPGQQTIVQVMLPGGEAVR